MIKMSDAQALLDKITDLILCHNEKIAEHPDGVFVEPLHPVIYEMKDFLKRILGQGHETL